MSNIHVAIKFKDNDVSASFYINKNNIFYGNNGRGKTRILRTVELLYTLAKSMDYDVLISQLNELNLSELKINKKNHSQLFSKYEESTSQDKKALQEFIENNKNILSSISEKLRTFLSSKRNDDFIINRRYMHPIIVKIEEIMKSRNIDTSIDEMQEMMHRINRTIIRRDSMFEDNMDLFDNRLIKHELVDLSRYFNQRLNELKFNIRENSINIRNELQKEKDRVLQALGNKGARYLTVDSNIESEKIFKEISDKIEKVNHDHIKNIWEDDSSIVNYTDSIKEYKEKIDNFNKIIKNYNKNIRIQLKSDGSIVFFKNGDEIEFIKLSSGEKRVSIIFLNLIFSVEEIILIDEPEISLSLDYQNKIIRDIMELTTSNGRKRVMIATHAPYIYADFTSYSDNDKVKV